MDYDALARGFLATLFSNAVLTPCAAPPPYPPDAAERLAALLRSAAAQGALEERVRARLRMPVR